MDRPARAFFVYFFSSYVLVLLISVIAFGFVYFLSHAQIQSKTTESVRLKLQRGRDLTEARLDEVAAGAYRITRTTELVDFMRVGQPFEPRHYYALLRLRGEFEQFNLTSSFVDSVYLVMRESGALLSTFYTSPDHELVFRNFLRYDGFTFDEWHVWANPWDEHVRLLPASLIHLHGRSITALTVRIPLPFGASHPRAVLMGLIPVSGIDQHFHPLLDSGATVSIVDRDGVVLYTTPAATDGTGGEMTLSLSSVSPAWGLSYRVVLPVSYVHGQLFFVRVVFAAVFVFTLLAGLAVATFFALRHSRPVARMFALMSRIDHDEGGGMPGQYSAFTNMMERLVGRQIDIERAVEKRDQLLRSGCFERLLRGGFPIEGESTEYMAGLGLTFSNEPLRVVVVTVESFGAHPAGDPADALVHGFLQSRIEPGVHLHKTREGDVLIVPATTRAIRAIETAFDELEEAGGIRVAAGAGMARASLSQLSESFDEAILALKTTFRRPDGWDLVVYRDQGETCELSEEDRRKLTAIASTGDSDGLRALLDSVRDRYFGDQSTSTAARGQLFTELAISARQIHSAACRPVPCGSCSTSFERLQEYRSAGEFFERLLEALVCAKAGAAGPNGHRGGLVGATVASYLQERYADHQLSLTSVADHFDCNPQYLSRLFHDQMHESFSAFLERVRMTAAKEAIEAGSEPLKTVAARTGFSSWNSFYKAFRRYYGVSPGRFRAQETQHVP